MELTESVDSINDSNDNAMKYLLSDSSKVNRKSTGISVVQRTRPLNSHELSKKEISVVEFPGQGQIKIVSQSSNKTFHFNVCFEPEADQEVIFEHSGIKKLTELAFEGYVSTCLVYGQTGSGKTYTMTGPPHEFLLKQHPDQNYFGICPRSFYYLFELLKNKLTYRVYASYLEIYNEQVKDLLNPQPLYPLNIRWRKRRGFYVDNLFLIECSSADDLLEVLQRGMRNRSFTSTNSNKFSSRSHCIFSIMIDTEFVDPADESIIFTKHGKLTFVDLAGSEKMKSGPEVSQNQLQETNNINRSLLVLGNCISCLSDPKRRNSHIPFRDSKLTKLLADSLGGNGVTLMFACISPAASMATDSVNTLRYATKALKIDNQPSMKLDPREKIIASLKKEVLALRQENILLKSQMIPNFRALSAKNHFESTGFSSKTSVREESPSIQIEFGHTEISLSSNPQAQDNQESNLNLCEMLQEYMIENENLRSQNLDIQKSKEKLLREQENLMKENEKLEEKMNELMKTIPNNAARMADRLPSDMSTQSLNSTSKLSIKKKPLNVDLTDTSIVDNSYVKIHGSKKRNSESLPSKRNYNGGTRLSPIKLYSETTWKNKRLLKNIEEISDEIKKMEGEII